MLTRIIQEWINPFVPNAPFLYPLKTPEYCKVFRFSLGLEKGCIRNKWVKNWRCINVHVSFAEVFSADVGYI